MLNSFFKSLWAKLRSGGFGVLRSSRYLFWRIQQIMNSVEHPSFRVDPEQPEPSLLPWDSWELDPKFFKALSQWTIDNPDTMLDHILDKTCVAIDHGRDFLELVPDTPFPVRSLLKALCHVVQLGVVWNFDLPLSIVID
jgi:hypothetical protein